MACTSVSISSPAILRSDSGNELWCDLPAAAAAKMRRSRSEPQLIRCALNVPRASAASATTTTKKMKSSRSVPMFPFNFTVPNAFKTLLFVDSDEAEAENAATEMRLVDGEEIGRNHENLVDEGIGKDKRANWMERILELRGRWRNRQQKEEEDEEEDEDEDDDDEIVNGESDYYCGAHYDSDSEVEEEEEWDPVKFKPFLTPVIWSETKLFSKLAFLCNMAYVIPEIKEEDLSSIYNLRLVTSSLEKKSEAAIKAKLDSDSTRPHQAPIGSDPAPGSVSHMRPIRPSVAYEIAASAASYVSSRAKGLLSLGGGGGAGSGGSHVEVRPKAEYSRGGGGGERMYKSEVAAYVAASTMTAVVAAEEEARLEAAESLQSLHSSPCEWFVCDDPNTCIRCFVIQGSDSLSSWQANLLFEPTKFEGTEALVHRGIYEAAKGIYRQFLPEIQSHLQLYGDRAKFRFTGHSLGGSLSMLVNLMLLARSEVLPSSLLPVVTFGSPSVFCGGRHVLEELGLDEGHIRSVVMHRDIVPRAFSCNYPDQIAQLLKRLNGTFRSHPCLNSEKLLYSPLGKLFILQPDEKSSPPHPLLPVGAALYSLDTKDTTTGAPKPGAASALKVFLNHPHPLDTLSDPTAYGSEGTILRDHDSCNYLKAVNELVREKNVMGRRRPRKSNYWFPNLTRTRSSPVSWGSHRGSAGLKEVVSTGV